MSDEATERERRVLQQYDRVLDVPASERRRFVREEFASDPALAQELERLLDAEARADSGFLNERAGAFAQPLVQDLDEHARQTVPGVTDELQKALLPRYTIDSRVGVGGMATVHGAWDHVMNKPVAIKVMRPELANTISADRFEQEIAITAKLDHPRIVPTFDRGSGEGVLFYVMRKVPGGSLRERLDAEHTLSVPDCISVARHVAEALDYAHSQGVVHRDIKPENILLDGNGAYVADFGIARLLDVTEPKTRESLTQTGLAIGTVLYMSPEQATPNGEKVTGRADVYSLACVMYEMLAGEPPFTAASQREVLVKHMVEDPPDLTAKCRSATPAMHLAIAAGLAKEADERLATCVELVNGFERAWLSPAKQGLEGAAGSQPGTTIAVLPFENMSRDRSNDYLGDGIAEELIGALIRAGGMRVIARSSSFAFRNHKIGVREIGLKLGATHIVEGSVKTAGRQLRASTQLVDASSGNALWSERFDRDFEDVFAVQDEITNAIVTRLREEFTVGGSQSGDLVFADFDRAEEPRLPPPPATPLRSTGESRFGGTRFTSPLEGGGEDRAFRSRFSREKPKEKIASDSTTAKLATDVREEYEIEDELGRGGTYGVYLARDLVLERKVVLKVLLTEFVPGEDYIARFKREAQIAAALTHPNIVQVYHVRTTPSLAYFVMEYIEGRSLRTMIEEQGALPVDVTRTILEQVGRALDYAHERGVAHCDIKPANIMIDRDGRAVVTDFSLARAVDMERLTAAGMVIGTPTYMSPEQISGSAGTKEADQYALGVVAYEMLMGKPPHQGTTYIELMKKHLFEEPAEDLAKKPGVPKKMAHAIARMMAKQSADRFPNIASAIRAFGPMTSEDETPSEWIAMAKTPLERRVRKFGPSAPAMGVVAKAAAPGVKGAGRSWLTYAATLVGLVAVSVVVQQARFDVLAALAMGGAVLGLGWFARWRRTRVEEARAPSAKERSVQLKKEEPVSPRLAAYNAYLRGRFVMNFESRPDSLDQAIQEFNAAIDSDPSYAQAYAARAYARSMQVRFGYARPATLIRETTADAEQALALGPQLAEAHVASALVSILFTRDVSAAMASLKTANELSPNSSDIYLWRGYARSWLEGNPKTAMRSLHRATDLDPLGIHAKVELTYACWMRGRAEEALHYANEAVEFGQRLGTKPRGDRTQPPQTGDGFASAHYARAIVLAELGRIDEALQDANEGRRLSPGFSMHTRQLEMLRAQSGDEAQARATRFASLLNQIGYNT